MKYRILGKTNLKASTLGMGLMRLPVAKENPDFNKAIHLIQHAISRGITFFDIGTFYCHSHCEKIFSLAIANSPAKSVLFCGKNSTHQAGSLKWVEQLSNTLRIFQKCQLDLYFLHHLDWLTWKSHFIIKGVINQILESKEKGLFRFLGFSSHDTADNVKNIIDTGYFSVVILPFNILQLQYREAMEYAHQQGIGVIAMNPLGGGILQQSFFSERNPIASLNKDWAGIALNYVLSQTFIDVTLSGMESTVIIDQNATLADNSRFTAEELQRIHLEVNHEQKKRWIGCTGCGYCLPCLQGIDIPRMIELYNQFSLVPGEQLYTRDFYFSSTNPENCVQCKVCQEKCPQNINIPKIMQDILKKYKFVR